MTKFTKGSPGFRSSYSSEPRVLRRLARYHSQLVLAQFPPILIITAIAAVVAKAYHPSNLSYSQQLLRLQQQIGLSRHAPLFLVESDRLARSFPAAGFKEAAIASRTQLILCNFRRGRAFLCLKVTATNYHIHYSCHSASILL